MAAEKSSQSKRLSGTNAKTPVPVRQTALDAETPGQPLERADDGTWHVRSYALARTLLQKDGTRQAGFQAELVGKTLGSMRPPILYQEGASHREQRLKTAPFFTHSMADHKYRDFMETYADELIADLKRRRQVDLSQLSMRMAVKVAAQVVGLTDSRRPGMARRIEAFFDQSPGSGLGALINQVRNQWRVTRFYVLDVQPAMAARRQSPREDVISSLLADGYSGLEIITECITFGAAGMVTTREFISVAAWHLLNHPEIRATYLAADEEERYEILHELLRLEPVVGHLLRRTTTELEVEVNGQKVTIPPGSLLNFHIYNANADEEAVGAKPHSYDPGRRRARGVQPYALSFGHGHHRCPGSFLAIQETDIFLTRLLSLAELEIVRQPDLTRNDLVKGYELRNFWVQLSPKY